MNMKVVVAGFNVVVILMERLLETNLDGQSLSLVMVAWWPLGHVLMVEEDRVKDLDMSGYMNMEVVVGLNVGGTLMERLLVTVPAIQFLSPVTAMYWPLEPKR